MIFDCCFSPAVKASGADASLTKSCRPQDEKGAANERAAFMAAATLAAFPTHLLTEQPISQGSFMRESVVHIDNAFVSESDEKLMSGTKPSTAAAKTEVLHPAVTSGLSCRSFSLSGGCGNVRGTPVPSTSKDSGTEMPASCNNTDLVSATFRFDTEEDPWPITLIPITPPTAMVAMPGAYELLESRAPSGIYSQRTLKVALGGIIGSSGEVGRSASADAAATLVSSGRFVGHVVVLGSDDIFTAVQAGGDIRVLQNLPATPRGLSEPPAGSLASQNSAPLRRIDLGAAGAASRAAPLSRFYRNVHSYDTSFSAAPADNGCSIVRMPSIAGSGGRTLSTAISSSYRTSGCSISSSRYSGYGSMHVTGHTYGLFTSAHTSLLVLQRMEMLFQGIDMKPARVL